MDFKTILNEHAATLIAVIGTLAGVLISQFSTWLMKTSEFKKQIKIKKIDLGVEFEKKYLIEPILLFLEADLKLMSRIYSKGIEVEKTEIDEQLRSHIMKMSMASARLRVYGNTDLNKKFDEFTRKRIDIGFKTLNENMKNMQEAYNHLKEAEMLASEIIILLKAKLERLQSLD